MYFGPDHCLHPYLIFTLFCVMRCCQVLQYPQSIADTLEEISTYMAMVLTSINYILHGREFRRVCRRHQYLCDNHQNIIAFQVAYKSTLIQEVIPSKLLFFPRQWGQLTLLHGGLALCHATESLWLTQKVLVVKCFVA